MKPGRALRKIREGRERLAEAVRAARKEIAKIESAHRYTAEARRAMVQARRDELREEIATIKAEAEEAVSAIRDAGPKPARPDAGEAQRIWNRQLRRLEAGEDPIALAQSLQQAGDIEGFQILQEELPDHLRVVEADPRLTRQTLEAVRRVEGDVLTSDRAEHRKVLDEAESAATLLSTNAGLAGTDLENTEAIYGETPIRPSQSRTEEIYVPRTETRTRGAREVTPTEARISHIPALCARAEERGHAIVEKTTLDIEANAKARLYLWPAIDTSALVNSGEHDVDGYEGEVGFGSGHANYVEFGTGERGAESLFPGKPDDITYTPSWSGMAAQPYLIPSVEEAREPFEMAVGGIYG